MNTHKIDWRKRAKQTGTALWLALWPLMLWAVLNPIRDNSVRLVLLGSAVGLWGGGVLLFRHKLARGAGVALMVLVGGFLLLPGRKTDPSQLRRDYVRSLTRYEGTTYVWGGETRRGIDCSGLVRRGLIDADWRLGLRTLNPTLARAGCSLWWHDCSAKALKEEYRGQTRFLFHARSLNQLNQVALLPGDFAVTDSGVHTLAYIGNSTWIEADPNAWKVIKVKVPSKNAWFSMPMHIMRWRQFE